MFKNMYRFFAHMAVIVIKRYIYILAMCMFYVYICINSMLQMSFISFVHKLQEKHLKFHILFLCMYF